MPHYFFDIDDGAAANATQGADLPDRDAAQAHAMRIAAAYAGEPVARDATGGGIIVDVRDGQGRRALVVRLAFHIERRGPSPFGEAEDRACRGERELG